MSEERHRICTILDRLTIDSLTLMEEEIAAKIGIENAMCSGESHLAKSRYILGQSSVSSLQIPAEDGAEFEPTLVLRTEDDQLFGEARWRLQTVEKENQVDPVRWFGYLVPQDLYHAQKMFQQALQWIVRAANVQTRLIETFDAIELLNGRKRELDAAI